MKKTIELKDSIITVNEEKFSVKSKSVSLGLAFSKDTAFEIEYFKSTAGKREVDYVESPKSILPIGKDDEESGEKKTSHELVNAVTRNDGDSIKAVVESGNWTLTYANAEKSIYGGAEILKLVAKAENDKYALTLNLLAFPECSVIRYWFDIENITEENADCRLIPFSLEIYSDRDYDIFRAAWFTAGVARQNFGRINEMDFGVRPPKVEISSRMTANYIPLVILYRDGAPKDGLMIEMDYVSFWNMSLEKTLRGIDCRFGFNGNDNIVGWSSCIGLPQQTTGTLESTTLIITLPQVLHLKNLVAIIY